jgi:hypothetical protein
MKLGAATTKQDVIEAFETMAVALTEDTRFVVMFAGHGIAAGHGHDFEAWALYGDVFSDVDLAAALAPFWRTDNVVISDCCFGGGMFMPNPPPELARGSDADLYAPIGQFTRSFATKLKDQLHAQLGHHDFPITSISAAGADGFVMASLASQLIEDTITAAMEGWTYARLAAQFQATAFTGRAFEILSRPPDRMELEILAP